MLKKTLLTLIWSFLLWLFFWSTFASSWSCTFSWNSTVSYTCMTTVNTPIFYSVSFSGLGVPQTSYITVWSPSFITVSNTKIDVARPFTVYRIDSSGTTWSQWPQWPQWYDWQPWISWSTSTWSIFSTWVEQAIIQISNIMSWQNIRQINDVPHTPTNYDYKGVNITKMLLFIITITSLIIIVSIIIKRVNNLFK